MSASARNAAFSRRPKTNRESVARATQAQSTIKVNTVARVSAAMLSLRTSLFRPNRPGYSDLAVDSGAVQQIALDSDEFKKFAVDVASVVDDWFSAHRMVLQAINGQACPQDLIARIGDDLLARFKHTPLLDEYDVYERLMTYGHVVMHDDVFLLMNDGWVMPPSRADPLRTRTASSPRRPTWLSARYEVPPSTRPTSSRRR